MKPARGIWISVAVGIPAWIVVLVVLYLGVAMTVSAERRPVAVEMAPHSSERIGW
jgi:hypothetical protein